MTDAQHRPRAAEFHLIAQEHVRSRSTTVYHGACSCGWIGPERTKQSEARNDAEDHVIAIAARLGAFSLPRTGVSHVGLHQPIDFAYLRSFGIMWWSI